MALRLEDDHHCFVCGTENPKGLHLQFERREPGRLASSVVFSRDHQGFKGIVHGGMMARSVPFSSRASARPRKMRGFSPCRIHPSRSTLSPTRAAFLSRTFSSTVAAGKA